MSPLPTYNRLLGPDETSFSELDTLATCEFRWVQRYLEGGDSQPTQAMRLGTIMHELTQAWHRDGDWLSAWAELMTDEYVGPDDEPWVTASWLMERYVEHYGPSGAADLEPYTLMGTEVELKMRVPGVGTVSGHLDEVWDGPDDGYILIERKTMRDWRRLDSLDIDPQQTIYAALAKANYGRNAVILFDAIRTYRWKRDPHPPEDSFQRQYLYRTDEQIAGVVRWMQAVTERKRYLTEHPELAIRNLGQACQGCSYQEQCYEPLCFPWSIDVVEDE